MKKTFYRKSQRGSILILALWTIAFLSIFAVHIGLRVRQRATLLSRLEKRSQLHFIAEAGVKKAIAALRLDLERNAQKYSPYGKYYRHNNRETFANISVGRGLCDVNYRYFDGYTKKEQLRFGLVDEESKININTVDRLTLSQLIQITTILPEDEAKSLAEAIYDWREFGRNELVGFYSDDYYANLKYPYNPKNAPFEVIDELLLVKGVSKAVFDQLSPFVTIYGDGLVNINTAPPQVLLALGFNEALVSKILLVRRGFDGIEATVDDYVFQKTFDVVSEMLNFIELEIDEIKQVDSLNAAGKIKTNSWYYLIQSRGRLAKEEEALKVVSVYNAKENRVEYWKEK